MLGLALVVASLAFVAHRALVPLAETDLFFHLKLGDLIRAQHAIPFRNLFSFTYPDHPDPDLSWGFQVAVSWLYAQGGFPAIVVFKTTLIVVASALAWRAAQLAGASPTACACATVLTIHAADQRLVERPHLVTFVGLGVLSILLEHVRQGRERLLWLVPPLALVWANFHAGVFLCIVALACFGLERPSRRWLLVLALSTLATVATPAGMRLPSYLLWHTGLGATRVIEEFRRATLYSDPWFFACIAVVTVGAVRGRLVRRVVPLLLVGVLAWRSVRFVAEWAFLATPLLALALSRPMGGAFDAWRRPLGVLGVCGLVGGILVERRDAPFSLALSPDVVPFAAIDYVTRNGLRDRLYEDLDVGCYLLWEGWPRWQVFQDARLPAYPDDFHRALDRTPLDPAAFDALLQRYGVDAALLSEPDVNMRAGSFDPSVWALVYRRDDAMIFVRRSGHADLVARDELPLRIRFRWLGGSSVEPLWSPSGGIDACDWSRRLVRALVEADQPSLAIEAHSRAQTAGCVIR